MEHPVLRCLAPELRATVVERSRRRTFAAGETIVHEGAPADALYLLLRGSVAAQTTTPAGETATVNVLGPGDSFGEIALVHPTARIASVVALERIETLTLTRDAFEDLRRREPAVDRLLVELLAEKVSTVTERLTEAYFVPVDTRVCRCLVRLARIYAGPEGRAVIPLTQETIATMVGAARPSVNRVLRALEDVGALVLTRGRLEVRDLGAVEERAR